MSLVEAQDRRAVLGELDYLLELLESPEARYHVREAAQLEIAAREAAHE